MSVTNVVHAFPRPDGKKVVRLIPREQVRVVLLFNDLHRSGKMAEMGVRELHAFVEKELQQYVSADSVLYVLRANPDWKWKGSEPKVKETKPKLRIADDVEGDVAAIQGRIQNLEVAVSVIQAAVDAVRAIVEIQDGKLAALLNRMNRIENEVIPPDHVSGRKT